ncbi:MlaD family protein [Nocardia sp. 348MFTsu5.1]|uniref:MlaD family protein n=1 Tax=Nocardia sp. 348MFTsu5.1 TaxID=1172185 RepID=UPI0003690C17|nr:MlaD family protein [Nocardia sp. 348MFTsu5.1]
MSYRKPLIGLIIFLVISIALTWTVFNTLRRSVDGPSTAYTAVFSDVSGLGIGDDVRMAGVRVGRVDSIKLDGLVAKVGFRVESDQQIYGNTKASITYENIIGQRYLGLSLGDQGDPVVMKGGEIPLERTEPSFNISVLLNGFEPLFSVLDPNQIDNITTSIIRALQGDNGSITTLVAQTSELAESFAGPDQILGDIIGNLDGIVRTFAEQRGAVDTVITQSQAMFTQLADRREELVTSIDSISTVVGRVATLANEAAPELNQFLTRQPGFAQHYMDNLDAFAYLGFNVPILLKGLARVTQAGAYIDTYLCTLNVTYIPALSNVIPSIVDAATPGGKTKFSPACQ